MIQGSCHCGAVQIELPHAPTKLTSCNCSICRRLGSLMAYYAPDQVRIAGDTATYCWGDRQLDFHRCTVCGCHTHWTLRKAGADRIGINARLLDPAVVAAARVRRFDGADTWTFLDEE